MTQTLEVVGMIAGSGVAGALITKLFERKQARASVEKTAAEEGLIDAEAAHIIAGTAVSLVAPLQAEIDKLTVRVGTLETENISTKSLLGVAIDHIHDLHLFIDIHLPGQVRPPLPPTLGLER